MFFNIVYHVSSSPSHNKQHILFWQSSGYSIENTCLNGKRDSLQWRHHGCFGVSNHQPHDCLLHGLFRRTKHQSSASLAFVRGIHRWPVNSPHKRPVMRKMFPFDDVIMSRILMEKSWYRNISSVQVICQGNPSATVRFSSQKISNAELWCFRCCCASCKKWSCRWFETIFESPSRSYDVTVMWYVVLLSLIPRNPVKKHLVLIL